MKRSVLIGIALVFVVGTFLYSFKPDKEVSERIPAGRQVPVSLPFGATLRLSDASPFEQRAGREAWREGTLTLGAYHNPPDTASTRAILASVHFETAGPVELQWDSSQHAAFRLLPEEQEVIPFRVRLTEAGEAHLAGVMAVEGWHVVEADPSSSAGASDHLAFLTHDGQTHYDRAGTYYAQAVCIKDAYGSRVPGLGYFIWPWNWIGYSHDIRSLPSNSPARACPRVTPVSLL